jgi:hypothetical protein
MDVKSEEQIMEALDANSEPQEITLPIGPRTADKFSGELVTAAEELVRLWDSTEKDYVFAQVLRALNRQAVVASCASDQDKCA